jgi:hypothetical protein
MNTARKNELTAKALGVSGTEFLYYRADRALWRVYMEDGESFTVTTHYFGTESTVLRLAAAELAKRGRPVKYA